MINYETWKMLNESNFNLGLKGYPVVSGIVGNHLGISEGGFPHDDDEDEDHDDEDHDDDEDDDDDGEEGGDKPPFGGKGKEGGKDGGLEGDLFGASKEEGPKKGFPPDDSEDMDGLPTPDQEMAGKGGEGEGEGGDDADMAKILGDVDPDLAFGADNGMTKMGDKTGDGLEDLTGGEEGEMGGEDLAGLGGGEEMGDDLAGLGGGEEGGDMGGEPCPDCNPDGAEQEGDPQCPTCHGTGFMDDAEMGDDLKGIGDDLEGLGDDMGGDDHKGAEHMAAGPVKIFNITHHHHHGHGQAQGPVDSPNVANVPDDPMASMTKYMGKGCNCESTVGHADETQADFFANLVKQASGAPRNKKYSSGIREDALFAPATPAPTSEPTAGQTGFAPHGRIGAIGGGYTQDDIKDIPTLGESRKYLTLEQFMAKKAAVAKKKKK